MSPKMTFRRQEEDSGIIEAAHADPKDPIIGLLSSFP